MRKKIGLFCVVLFFLLAGNAFAITFDEVAIWSDNKSSGIWNLTAEVYLNGESSFGSSTVTYSFDSGFNPMVPTTFGSYEYYGDNVMTTSGWSSPTSANGEIFTWKADDGSTLLEVSAYVPADAIKKIQLSYGQNVLDANPAFNTIEWYNNDNTHVTEYRVRVFDASGNYLGHENIISGYSQHVVHNYTGFTFIPGVSYKFRIEAREYGNLEGVTGDPTNEIRYWNRSSVWLDYNPVLPVGASISITDVHRSISVEAHTSSIHNQDGAQSDSIYGVQWNYGAVADEDQYGYHSANAWHHSDIGDPLWIDAAGWSGADYWTPFGAGGASAETHLEVQFNVSNGPAFYEFIINSINGDGEGYLKDGSFDDIFSFSASSKNCKVGTLNDDDYRFYVKSGNKGGYKEEPGDVPAYDIDFSISTSPTPIWVAGQVEGDEYELGAKGWHRLESGQNEPGFWVHPLQIEAGYYGTYYVNVSPGPDGIPGNEDDYDQREGNVEALDCSGLVMWAYNKAAGATKYKDSNNPIYFAGAHSQWLCNTIYIDRDELQPGDLVFYDKNNDGKMDHVGIYIGCDKILHAKGEADGIKSDPIDFISVDSYGRVTNPFTQGPCSGLFSIVSHSPVDLVVTDPDGITVESKTVTVNETEAFRGIPGVYEYFEADVDGDGETDDIVTVIERKIGEYQIEVVPEEGASPTDTYSLEIEADGEVVSLAEDVLLGDVPSHEHVITVTETGIETALPVEIDIKPGSDPNSINLKSKGVIPVAILTTDVFDATTSDALSVRFGPSEASEAHGEGHIEDVDKDGDLDMVLHFRTQATGIACGDTSASLTGKTLSGQDIIGTDSIKTKNCN